jgi:hypothetical protein
MGVGHRVFENCDYVLEGFDMKQGTMTNYEAAYRAAYLEAYSRAYREAQKDFRNITLRRMEERGYNQKEMQYLLDLSDEELEEMNKGV